MRRRLGAAAAIALLTSVGIGVTTTTHAVAAETHSNCVTFDSGGNIVGEVPNCSQTQTVKNQVMSMPYQNPCSLAPGTLTENLSNQILHTNVNGAGDIWITSTQTGTVSFVPSDSSQPSYAGHLTDWFGTSLNRSNASITGTVSLNLTGTDGTMITMHMVSHTSFSSTGIVTSFSVGGWNCP